MLLGIEEFKHLAFTQGLVSCHRTEWLHQGNNTGPVFVVCRTSPSYASPVSLWVTLLRYQKLWWEESGVLNWKQTLELPLHETFSSLSHESHKGSASCPEKSDSIVIYDQGCTKRGYHISKTIKTSFWRLKFKNEINDVVFLTPDKLTQN